MRNINKLIMILVTGSLLGLSPNAQASDGNWVNTDIRKERPGSHIFRVRYDGKDRDYMVHIPKTYTEKRKTPVIFAFHGGGGDRRYMANDLYYGLISSSEKNGYIVVFPNGYSNFPSGKLATWNAGKCCWTARDEKIDDVGFVRKIVTALKGKLNVDDGRIYAIGMSNGGMMSYRLACEAADLFKAIASVAGTDNTLKCDPFRPISVLHIHALDDDHVLFNGGAGEDAFRDLSKVTEFTSVPGTINLWTKRDGCEGPPERVLQNDGAYCDLYAKCKGGTQVKLCVTKSGGHSWPGGTKPHASEPPSTAISANDEIWKFFQSLE